MIEIVGKYNTAFVHTNKIDDTSRNQLQSIVDCKFVDGESIHVMPDVHAGKGSVIGFTCTNNNKRICPNIVGVDIGCGVSVYSLGTKELDLAAIDQFIINNIPNGFKVHNANRFCNMFHQKMLERLNTPIASDKWQYILNSVGTLGGGNHYIEIDIDQRTGEKYLVVHSGSRHLGVLVAEYFQSLATQVEDEAEDLWSIGGELRDQYINDMLITQAYAQWNRAAIAKQIIDFIGVRDDLYCESIHNYYNIDDNTIRKGAISANHCQRVIIPLTMRDGAIIATGKGNRSVNCSAPHGAGRLYSRGQANRTIKLEDFESSMQGIYSTSVCKSTIDESPFAYKDVADIINNIGEMVTIDKIIKPVYNFKAH